MLPPPPTPPYMRVRVRRFLAVLADRAALFLCHEGRCPKLSQSAWSLRDKTRDGRVLPARFSPSRVVRPSGLPGSLLSVLWPRLTPAPARRSWLAAAPTVTGGTGLQVSLSKHVNSCCTTGPFISGTEHRAVLCCASSPVPSTLYGLSVRRLISFDRWLPSHETSRFRSCFGLMFRSSFFSYERPDNCVHT